MFSCVGLLLLLKQLFQFWIAGINSKTNQFIMRNFREMQIWNEGIVLTLDVYRIVRQLPKEEEYGLKSQLKRAAVSIPSNIAEGCSRHSEKEFKYFLEISLGSAFEIETQFIMAQKLNMISEEDLVKFLQDLHVEQKKINALISKIKSDLR